MEKNVPQAMSYTQCLELAQNLLKEMSQTHGRLKKWCDEHELYYKTILKFKNNKLGYYAPQLVLRILNLLGYSATLTRTILPDLRNEEDIFIVTKIGE